MLDSLYRRPRGRRLAPVISRLTGGKVAAEPSPEERWFRDHWQAAYQVLEYVDVTGKSVADIGSGDGIIDLALTLGGKPRELVGYDVNPTPVDHLLDVASRYGGVQALPRELSFRPSDPERIDAPDAAYDVVITWSVFEHARDPLGLLREMRRIVKPDGVLFLQLWPFYYSHSGSHLWDWFPEPFHHLQQPLEEIEAGMGSGEWPEYMLAEYKTLNKVTVDELGEAVREAGFSIRELELMGQRSRVPAGLDAFPLSSLGVTGVKLLAVPV
jgi:SAM-dependent methyltransferase